MQAKITCQKAGKTLSPQFAPWAFRKECLTSEVNHEQTKSFWAAARTIPAARDTISPTRRGPCNPTAFSTAAAKDHTGLGAIFARRAFGGFPCGRSNLGHCFHEQWARSPLAEQTHCHLHPYNHCFTNPYRNTNSHSHSYCSHYAYPNTNTCTYPIRPI